MEFTPIQPIQPLWSSMTQPVQETRDPASSLFSTVFQQAIQNVRDTSAAQADAEYQLSTGQIDNPAVVTLTATKAETAALLLMEMRNKAVDVYNEIMRISL